MQAVLQGKDVAPGHGGHTGTQGPPRPTSKIGSEEKLGSWLSTVCPVSAASGWRHGCHGLAIGIFRTLRRSAAGTAGPPELRQRLAVQLTGRSVSGSASLRSSQSYR